MIVALIKNFIIALLIGLVITIASLQYDPHIQAIITKGFVDSFEKMLDCRLECRLKSLNLFIPRLEFENVHVSARQGSSWHWKAKTYTTSFSWWHFFTSGSINLQVKLTDAHVYSELKQNELAIIPHLKRMVVGPMEIPLFVKSIDLEKATFTVQDIEKKRTYSLTWASTTKKINRTLKSHIRILDAHINQAYNHYLHSVDGTFDIDVIESVKSIPTFAIHCSLSGTLDTLLAQPLACYATVSWQDNNAECTLKTSDPSCYAHIKINPGVQGYELHVQAQTPLSYGTQLLGTTIPLSGNAHANLRAQLNSPIQTLSGTCSLHQVYYQKTLCCDNATLKIQPNEKGLAGSFIVNRENTHIASGSAKWNSHTKLCSLNFHNTSDITIPFLPNMRIHKKEAHLAATITTAGSVQATYKMQLEAPEKEKNILQGSLLFTHPHVAITGTYNTSTYALDAQMSPHIQLQQATITSAQGTRLLDAQSKADNPEQIHGSINILWLQSLLLQTLGITVQAQGTLAYELSLSCDKNKIACRSYFSQGSIRIPHTYNYIHSAYIDLAIDMTQKKAQLNQATAHLYKGKIECKDGVALFDEQNNISYLHIPLMCTSCLFTLQKGISASLSGALLLEKKDSQKPLINGNLIIERGQLKENILSPTVFATLLDHASTTNKSTLPDIQTEITIQTKEPIKIATGFMQTNAHVNLRIGSSTQAPHISGSIKLHTGSLAFPYKPLYITKALIHFHPGHENDPTIELVAKNTIKKHQIILQVTGSLQHPQVMLESSPPLTEDQIVGLLMIGSHQDPLSTIVPALVLQNLKDLMFSADQSPLSTDTRLKQLLKPLKRVHLIPRFTDQTGRGGLRGAVEIDVTDRLSVLLQKNFSLYDDTRLEVEYTLSDDISLRGVRDERKDITGEVEMKWKF